MPTYVYVCEACGHKLEIQQKMLDEPLKNCPECKEERLKREIGPVRVIFKGTGWTPKGNKVNYE